MKIKTYNIIISILLICVIVLSVTSYKLSIRQPKTIIMCNLGGMIAVRAKPFTDAQIIYALSTYDKIWWSGPRTEHWLYIDYAYGSGWIETSAELGECLPEINFNPYDRSNKIDG